MLGESFWLLPMAAAFFFFPLNSLRPAASITWGDVAMTAAAGCAFFRLAYQRRLMGVPAQFFLPVIPFVFATALAFVDFQDFDDFILSSQLIITLILIPATVAFAGQGYRHTVIVLAWAWILGNLFSSAVGIASHRGHGFLGFVDPWATNKWSDYRIAGLAVHPNMYAMFATMSVPVVLTRIIASREKIERIIAVIVLPILLYGIKLSGSRAALAALLMIGAIFGCMYAYYSRRPAIALAQILIAGAILVATYLAFDTGQTVDATSRLFSGTGTERSDSLRADIHGQALQDFESSPLYGVGFKNIRFAHNIYLQVLQSSGVIGFFGFALYLFIIFRIAQLGLRRTLLERELSWTYLSLICAILTWLLAGTNQNAIIERGVCIPIALLLLLYMNTFRESLAPVRPMFTR